MNRLKSQATIYAMVWYYMVVCALTGTKTFMLV